MKAVFVFRFTSFVHWPEKDFATPESPFVVGVLGHDPFESDLEAAVRNERVGTHPIVIRHLSREMDLDGCHLLFVARGEERAIKDRKLTALTVGETDAFLADGGAIRLATERNRIKIQINLRAAQAAGLVVSSQLLRIAEVIDEK